MLASDDTVCRQPLKPTLPYARAGANNDTNPASIPFWVTISAPAKRHSDGVSLARLYVLTGYQFGLNIFIQLCVYIHIQYKQIR